MSEIKFKNKYRIPSNRLKNWDYSENADKLSQSYNSRFVGI